MFLFDTKYYSCPFDCFISILKGKWRSSILLQLAQKPQRFAQLQKQLKGISAKVLAENLQLFEENNILHREVFATIPPAVEYSLTEKGKVLIGIMGDINDWSHIYLTDEHVPK